MVKPTPDPPPCALLPQSCFSAWRALNAAMPDAVSNFRGCALLAGHTGYLHRDFDRE